MSGETGQEGCFKMRHPCKYEECLHPYGHIVEQGTQDCVYCDACGKYQYNAPRTDTGKKVRSIKATHDLLSLKTRNRIFERAGLRCEMCGASVANGASLHVGHLLSVADGHSAGLTDQQINNQDNLAALCDACNLGQGARSVPLWLAVAMIRARDAGDKPA